MTESDENKLLQVISGDHPRVAGRDYIEIGQLEVHDLKTTLAFLPQSVLDALVVRNASTFRAVYGFAADISEEQRRKVVEIKNGTGFGEPLLKHLKWAGMLRLTERGAYLAPCYVSEAVGCFQAVSFLSIFLMATILLFCQTTVSVTHFPAVIVFISSQLGFAALSYCALFRPSRIARRGLQLLSRNEATSP